MEESGRDIGLRKYLRHFLKQLMKNKKSVWKNLSFFSFKLTIPEVWNMPNGFMTNWVTH